MRDDGPADVAIFVVICLLIVIVASVIADGLGYLEGYRR